MCQRCGTRCFTCGWAPGDPTVKPEPDGEDPAGPARPFTCRYCDVTLDSAEAIATHQAQRHSGVGRLLVTDVLEEQEAGG